MSVKPAGPDPGSLVEAERLLALWLPGDHPLPLDAGTGFDLPAGADIVVRVRYRKTWEYENRPMSDRSSVGLYFADAAATTLGAVSLTAPDDVYAAGSAAPGSGAQNPADAGVSFATTLSEAVRAVAVYPDPDLANVAVTVSAIRPDKSREELIAFRPRSGWARRYWFREPIVLPRGTRIEVQARFDDALLPPGTVPTPAGAKPRVRLTLNVVPES
jgi:hypothetical protein